MLALRAARHLTIYLGAPFLAHRACVWRQPSIVTQELKDSVSPQSRAVVAWTSVVCAEMLARNIYE
jgi:hypothetical protein